MSPEVAIAQPWRNVFMSPSLKQNLVLVSVDEAHCICEWLVAIVDTTPTCLWCAFRIAGGVVFVKHFTTLEALGH